MISNYYLIKFSVVLLENRRVAPYQNFRDACNEHKRYKILVLAESYTCFHFLVSLLKPVLPSFPLCFAHQPIIFFINLSVEAV